jgi:hypothetical protein
MSTEGWRRYAGHWVTTTQEGGPLPWDDLNRDGRPLDEVLSGVLLRGRKLRRRRRMAVRGVGSLTIVVCLVGVAAAFASTGSPDGHRVVDVADSPTTVDVADDTTTTAVESPSTTSSPESTSTTVAAAHQAHPTTTSSLYCRNSTDPGCGPFRWDPEPGPNQPLTIQVTFSPSQPVAGQPVTFHITASDPDAYISHHGVDFGDAMTAMLAPAAYWTPHYGPWTPPAPHPDRKTFDEQHVYSAPGTYTMTARAWSANDIPGGTFGPYDSGGEAWTVQVVVGGSAPSSTTTVPSQP